MIALDLQPEIDERAVSRRTGVVRTLVEAGCSHYGFKPAAFMEAVNEKLLTIGKLNVYIQPTCDEISRARSGEIGNELVLIGFLLRLARSSVAYVTQLDK